MWALRPGERLDAVSTALVLFDFLEGHVRQPDGTTRDRYRDILPRAQRLLIAARTTGVVVIHAVADHRGDGSTRGATRTDTDNRLRPHDPTTPAHRGAKIESGTASADIIAELAPDPADHVVRKLRWSAFHATSLDLILRTLGIRTLILAGGSTDVGLASTAYAARDLDYDVIIAADACAAHEVDNHRQFLLRVFPRMARVRTVEAIVSMLSVDAAAGAS